MSLRPARIHIISAIWATTETLRPGVVMYGFIGSSSVKLSIMSSLVRPFRLSTVAPWSSTLRRRCGRAWLASRYELFVISGSYRVVLAQWAGVRGVGWTPGCAGMYGFPAFPASKYLTYLLNSHSVC